MAERERTENGRRPLSPAWVLVALNIAALIWGAAKLDSSVSRLGDGVGDLKMGMAALRISVEKVADSLVSHDRRLLKLEVIPEHRSQLGRNP
jgi:Sec-independent protein translocase protein TatA